jgi:hypothetical protein
MHAEACYGTVHALLLFKFDRDSAIHTYNIIHVHQKTVHILYV